MHNPVEQFSKNRKTEVETLIVAVLMATGVNILVSGIAMAGIGMFWIYITIGVVIVIVSIMLYRYRFISDNSIHERVRGFFLYDIKKRELIDVPNYDAVLRMRNYMRSSSGEIQRVWKNNSIGNLQYVSGRLTEEITESYQIITELLEYCVIEILSTCLIDGCGEINEKQLKRIGRDDVPDVLQNRFLYWFSKEPEGLGDLKKYIEIDGCTLEEAFCRIADEGRGSKPYHHFELILPKESTVSRKDDKIIIESPLLIMAIKCVFTGSSANTPLNFKRLYLNAAENENDIKAFSMCVEVDVQFKGRCLFSSDIINQYAWIDKFLNHLNEMISEDYYYEKIGWGTAETVIRCNKCQDMI